MDADAKSTIKVSDATPAPAKEGEDTYLTYEVKVETAVGSNVVATISIDPSSTATVGNDFDPQLEYQDADGNWQPLPANGQITLPADTTVVPVRVKVLDDAITLSLIHI